MFPVTKANLVASHNAGSSKKDSLGWEWTPVNEGKPLDIPDGPHSNVMFGHINANKRADYMAFDTKAKMMRIYLNAGKDGESFKFKSGGVVKIGPSDPKNIRLADIDGDGFWDIIVLGKGGRAEIYRNTRGEDRLDWPRLEDYEPSGIGRPPAEIQFIDMNGDGKADYVWTEPITGSIKVWLNNHPKLPAWLEVGEVTKGAGTSGANMQFARLRPKKNYQYVVVDPNTGALGAWFNRQRACICVEKGAHVSKDIQCGFKGPIW
ncbi:hypothetical protein F53441_1563 [Fusarium austroafricanum]|uniref:VCBS repeat-containing protein n=1 Tax=Fusarium austroafricanum TaxID=2364996 RepID=A0A8H4NYT7_9HYPO|nr:hypothetical protein F53441_1563 [Fusarium austroafricanum]